VRSAGWELPVRQRRKSNPAWLIIWAIHGEKQVRRSAVK